MLSLHTGWKLVKPEFMEMSRKSSPFLVYLLHSSLSCSSCVCMGWIIINLSQATDMCLNFCLTRRLWVSNLQEDDAPHLNELPSVSLIATERWGKAAGSISGWRRGDVGQSGKRATYWPRTADILTGADNTRRSFSIAARAWSKAAGLGGHRNLHKRWITGVAHNLRALL